MTIGADEILDVIAEETGRARTELSPDTRLDALGTTSLDMINILFVVEDRYGVTIAADDLKGAETIGDLVTLAQARAADPA